MARTVRAIFDGEALRPEHPLDLRPNARYVVTIEGEVEGQEGDKEEDYPLTQIARLAADMGVTDLSAHHDMYAHRRLRDA